MSYGAKVALLGGIIDYAGTFPPAALSLENALKRAASWRVQGKHPWLMGKIALPLEAIKKIGSAELINAGADGSAWIYTALGTAVPNDATSPEFYKTVEWDLREIRRCQERWFYSCIRQEIISYETKLPQQLTEGDSIEAIYDFVSPVLDRTSRLVGSEIRDFFFEVALDKGEKGIDNTIEAIVDWLDENEDAELVPGIKVRTGGNFVPTAALLAHVIERVCGNGLRFKATQGLHSALTHGKDFGFVNLFGALALAQSYGREKFGVDKIEACLSNTDKKEFILSGEKFSWKEFSLNCEEIESARRQHGATFGSCSLDEPDVDLAKEF